MNGTSDTTSAPRRWLRSRRLIGTVGTVVVLAGGVGFVASGPASAQPRQNGVSCITQEARGYDLDQAGNAIAEADIFQEEADEETAAGDTNGAALDQGTANTLYRAADRWMNLSEVPLC